MTLVLYPFRGGRTRRLYKLMRMLRKHGVFVAEIVHTAYRDRSERDRRRLEITMLDAIAEYARHSLDTPWPSSELQALLMTAGPVLGGSELEPDARALILDLINSDSLQIDRDAHIRILEFLRTLGLREGTEFWSAQADQIGEAAHTAAFLGLAAFDPVTAFRWIGTRGVGPSELIAMELLCSKWIESDKRDQAQRCFSVLAASSLSTEELSEVTSLAQAHGIETSQSRTETPRELSEIEQILEAGISNAAPDKVLLNATRSGPNPSLDALQNEILDTYRRRWLIDLRDPDKSRTWIRLAKLLPDARGFDLLLKVAKGCLNEPHVVPVLQEVSETIWVYGAQLATISGSHARQRKILGQCLDVCFANTSMGLVEAVTEIFLEKGDAPAIKRLMSQMEFRPAYSRFLVDRLTQDDSDVEVTIALLKSLDLEEEDADKVHEWCLRASGVTTHTPTWKNSIQKAAMTQAVELWEQVGEATAVHG